MELVGHLKDEHSYAIDIVEKTFKNLDELCAWWKTEEEKSHIHGLWLPHSLLKTINIIINTAISKT